MIENLVRQDDIKVEVANFCAVMDTLIDQDGCYVCTLNIVCSQLSTDVL